MAEQEPVSSPKEKARKYLRALFFLFINKNNIKFIF